jgi:hypothetical protein
MTKRTTTITVTHPVFQQRAICSSEIWIFRYKQGNLALENGDINGLVLKAVAQRVIQAISIWWLLNYSAVKNNSTF